MTTGLNLVERVIVLEAVELFRALTPEQLSRIATIAKESHVATGKIILEPSALPDALFVVIEGRLDIRRDGELLYTAGPNEVVGSWALFDEEPLNVGVSAAAPTRLLRISRDDFYDLLADHVEITAAIFTTLVRRFRRLAGT